MANDLASMFKMGGGMGGGSPVFGSLAPLASSFMNNKGYGGGYGAGGGVNVPTIQAPQRPNIQMPTPMSQPAQSPGGMGMIPESYMQKITQQLALAGPSMRGNLIGQAKPLIGQPMTSENLNKLADLQRRALRPQGFGSR